MSQLMDSVMLEAMDDITDSVSDNMLDSLEGSHYTDIAYMDDIDDLEEEIENNEGVNPEYDVMSDPESMSDDELIDLVLSGEEDF